jgi:hypothetical protein
MGITLGEEEPEALTGQICPVMRHCFPADNKVSYPQSPYRYRSAHVDNVRKGSTGDANGADLPRYEKLSFASR